MNDDKVNILATGTLVIFDWYFFLSRITTQIGYDLKQHTMRKLYLDILREVQVLSVSKTLASFSLVQFLLDPAPFSEKLDNFANILPLQIPLQSMWKLQPIQSSPPFVLSSFADLMDKWILCSSCIFFSHVYLSSSFVKLAASSIPPTTHNIPIQSTYSTTVLHLFKMAFLKKPSKCRTIPGKVQAPVWYDLAIHVRLQDR